MRDRSLYPRMAAALLALLGLFDSAHLTLSRYQESADLICPVGGGCETVQMSRWSTFPSGDGIPVALIGLLGYTALLMLALVALQRDWLGRLPIPSLLLMLASGGMLFSFYLTVLQFFVIQAICFWCIASAVLELGIFVAVVADWRAWRAAKHPAAQPMATATARR
jgi:uncharacterized membrane protein